MAIFFPTLDEIKHDTMEKHTAGELAILQNLSKLPDEYNIYFQPHINCAHPDIVIECAGRGILIIEVKDWNLGAYTFFDDGKYGYLTISGSHTKLATPFEQVQDYKDELFEAISPELCEAKLLNERVSSNGKKVSPVYGVVRTCVYFHRASADEVKSTFGESYFSPADGMMRYRKFTTCWTKGDLENIHLMVVRLLKQKQEYTRKLHEAITALFVPSMEWLEQMVPVPLDNEQKKYAECTPGRRIRILGTPGSGKTLVLAQKAVSCYTKKKETVLVLTFNITLKNYIRDKIAVLSREMSQRERSIAFEIVHLDQFLPLMLRKYGLKAPSIEAFKVESGILWDQYRAEQMRILTEAGDVVKPYSTVLIDEAQDFPEEWFSFIDHVFVSRDADYLVVADEKQNVYGRPSEEKLPKVSGFSGRWSKLKSRYRMTESGYHLAVAFQQEFMRGKYNIDDQIQIGLFSIMEKRTYIRHDEFNPLTIVSDLRHFMEEGAPISPNDICILTCSNDDLRRVDKQYRDLYGSKSTQTVSETAEWYRELRRKLGLEADNLTREEQAKLEVQLEEKLSEIRHVKRNAFNMNPGVVKISTVHSFKGWEINTVVLVLNKSDQEITPELVYTAITRTKSNLLIIDCCNSPYGAFFESELSLK